LLVDNIVKSKIDKRLEDKTNFTADKNLLLEMLVLFFINVHLLSMLCNARS